MDITELKEKLILVNQMGYVVSKRKGNTGIGYTLETLLGLKENNLITPDFEDIELKSHRKGVSSKVTMFTFNRGAWKLPQKEVIKEYGYIDTNNRPSLYSTVNTRLNNQGFFIKIEEENVRLYHINEDLIAEWTGENLINRFRKKMPDLVFVFADTRINSDGREEFWFNEAYYLTQPNVKNFLDLIRTDTIIIDLRMHLNKNNAVRNHGTGFRIEERFLNLCFNERENLI